jgi:hypothetical protein
MARHRLRYCHNRRSAGPQEKAAKLGLKLTAAVQSEQQFDFGRNQWDLVVLTYQPFRDILDRVKASLKEGGVVVIENFQRDTKRYRFDRRWGRARC